MTANRQMARLSALEGRTAQLPTRNGRTMPVETKLGRLTAQAYASYMMLVNEGSHRNPTLSASQKTTVSGAHKHQLLRAVSFAVTAAMNSEDIHENLRTELHQIFGLEHPGISSFGYEAASYQWHEDKHPDALALYVELCAEEYL